MACRRARAPRPLQQPSTAARALLCVEQPRHPPRAVGGHFRPLTAIIPGFRAAEGLVRVGDQDIGPRPSGAGHNIDVRRAAVDAQVTVAGDVVLEEAVVLRAGHVSGVCEAERPRGRTRDVELQFDTVRELLRDDGTCRRTCSDRHTRTGHVDRGRSERGLSCTDGGTRERDTEPVEQVTLRRVGRVGTVGTRVEALGLVDDVGEGLALGREHWRGSLSVESVELCQDGVELVSHSVVHYGLRGSLGIGMPLAVMGLLPYCALRWYSNVWIEPSSVLTFVDCCISMNCAKSIRPKNILTVAPSTTERAKNVHSIMLRLISRKSFVSPRSTPPLMRPPVNVIPVLS